MRDLDIQIFSISSGEETMTLTKVGTVPDVAHTFMGQEGSGNLFITPIPILDINGTGVLAYRGKFNCLVVNGIVVAIQRLAIPFGFEDNIINVGTQIPEQYWMYGLKYSSELMKDIRTYILNTPNTETLFEDELIAGFYIACYTDRTIVHELHNITTESHVFRTWSTLFIDSSQPASKGMEIVIPGNSSIKVIVKYTFTAGLFINCIILRGNNVEKSYNIYSSPL